MGAPRRASRPRRSWTREASSAERRRAAASLSAPLRSARAPRSARCPPPSPPSHCHRDDHLAHARPDVDGVAGAEARRGGGGGARRRGRFARASKTSTSCKYPQAPARRAVAPPLQKRRHGGRAPRRRRRHADHAAASSGLASPGGMGSGSRVGPRRRTRAVGIDPSRGARRRGASSPNGGTRHSGTSTNSSWRQLESPPPAAVRLWLGVVQAADGVDIGVVAHW